VELESEKNLFSKICVLFRRRVSHSLVCTVPLVQNLAREADTRARAPPTKLHQSTSALPTFASHSLNLARSWSSSTICWLRILDTTTARMDLPPSSPRLPSPPPPTEIQIGPKSPSLGNFTTQEPTIEQGIIEANAGRRIHPGTKSADMAAGPPLIPLNEVSHLTCIQATVSRIDHITA
jgi:hypothetical protein